MYQQLAQNALNPAPAPARQGFQHSVPYSAHFFVRLQSADMVVLVGAHNTITSFLVPSAKTTTSQIKPVITVSSISTPFPSKLTKRKNYLRPKLLKTLTKPFPLEPPSNPIITIETTHQQDLELPSDQISGEPCPVAAGEEEKMLEFSENSGTVGVTGVLDGSVGKFSTRSVLKFGMYLVGMFVLQTICSVWVLGSANSDKEHGNSESEIETGVLESSTNGINKKKFLLNGNGNSFRGKIESKPGAFVYVDESELEAKISEIRAMAREARESERKEGKNNEFVSDFDDDEAVSGSANSRVRNGIEKEVDARLIKLQKRLNSIWDKSPGSLVSYLNKFGKVEDKVDKDSLDANEVNSALMYKKKHKFRSQFTKPKNDRKGFQGLEYNSRAAKKKKSGLTALDSMMISESIGVSGLNSLDQEQQIDLAGGNLQESINGMLEKEEGRELLSKESKSIEANGLKVVKKVGQEMGVANTKSSTGVVQETSNVGPPVEEMKSRESSELETRNSPNFTKEKQDTIAKSGKAVLNSSSQRREVGSKTVANKIRETQSDFENDLWWSNLPYAMAILLRRGSDREDPGGLYTLKINSHAQNQSVSAYTVAFEDSGDANNFCYLLDSFFEDLGDFSADIVPLSRKELQEAVKSRTMKLLVVKKGQLQLYAGQPLADVEMALCSLVVQS